MNRKFAICFACAAALAFAFLLSGQSSAPAQRASVDDPNYLPRVTPIKPGMAPKMKVDVLPALPSRTFLRALQRRRRIDVGHDRFRREEQSQDQRSSRAGRHQLRRGLGLRSRLRARSSASISIRKASWSHCRARSRCKKASRSSTLTWFSCWWMGPCMAAIWWKRTSTRLLICS